MRFQLLIPTLSLVLVHCDIILGATSDRLPAPPPSFCNKYLHKTNVTKGNCFKEIATVSCNGRCHSNAEPIIYYSRGDVPTKTKPFDQTCECCSATDKIILRKFITLNCPGKRTETVRVLQSLALECACTDCDLNRS